MLLSSLFTKCLGAEYIHVDETDGDYAIGVDYQTLYIYLQWSNSDKDWKNNFDFPTVPYRDMPKTWRAHRGFVKVWKSIEPMLTKFIMDKQYKRIIVVGYSHGAALAALAHEYIWFNRPDIRENCFSFAFEAPRVFWGIMPKALKERWNNFYVIRNGKDIVTHLPFAFMGFRHVGKMIKIGQDRKPPHNDYFLKCISEHDWKNVLNSLYKKEEEGELVDIGI